MAVELLVDAAGIPLWSPVEPQVGLPAGATLGMRLVEPLPTRLVWAGMSRRYEPSHPPGEVCLFGMDFSLLLPVGLCIGFAGLKIFNNTFLSSDVSKDWEIGDVTIVGRQVWSRLAGGVEGSDYQLQWNISDNDYNVYIRRALVLCSQGGLG